jgi:hypothetical protein
MILLEVVVGRVLVMAVLPQSVIIFVRPFDTVEVVLQEGLDVDVLVIWTMLFEVVAVVEVVPPQTVLVVVQPFHTFVVRKQPGSNGVVVHGVHILAVLELVTCMIVF